MFYRSESVHFWSLNTTFYDNFQAIFRMLARLNNWHMISSHDFNHERLFEDAQVSVSDQFTPSDALTDF